MGKLIEDVRAISVHAIMKDHIDEWFRLINAIKKAAKGGKSGVVLVNDYGDNAENFLEALKLEGFYAAFVHEGRGALHITWK